MTTDADDIVETLTAWADVIDGVSGRAQVILLSGEPFREAADEIVRLRTLCGDAEARRLSRARIRALETEVEELRTERTDILASIPVMIEGARRPLLDWGTVKTCTSCGYYDAEEMVNGWGWCGNFAASRPVTHFCAEWDEARRG